MASDLLKQAISGEDVGLMQITWLCENNELLPEDIVYLKNKAKKLDACNQHEKYLIACLYTFGARKNL